MDCDGAFRVLLSGPFPSGAVTDGEVEHHLSVCRSCAAFAEALRPAPDVYHESLTPSESRGLPGYHGVVGCESLTLGAAPVIASQRAEPRGALASAIERLAPVERPYAVSEPAAEPDERAASWVGAALVIGFAVTTIAAVSGFGWLTP